jgi:hypothetical protein
MPRLAIVTTHVSMPFGEGVLPSCVSVRVLALFALAANSALAQPLHPDQWISARGLVTGGVTLRDLDEGVTRESPPVIQLSPRLNLTTFYAAGAVYTRTWFGVTADVRSDLVSVRPEAAAEESGKIPQPSLRGAVAATFRWQPNSYFGLEGQVGWHGAMLSFLTLPPAPTGVRKGTTGPAAGLVISVDPTERFGFQLSAHGHFGFGSAEGGALLFAGNVRYGFLRIGALDVGLAVTAELMPSGYTVRHGPDFYANEGVMRLGIGPSFVIRQPAPVAEVVGVSAPSVVGSVTDGDGTPLVKASISSQGINASTDERGAFALEGLAPGSAVLRAEAPGLRPATKDVIVTPGTPVEVRFILTAPTGPGSIKGVVRAGPDKPLAGAKVAVGAATLTTSASGEWSVTDVGPGPVKVKVTLDGYVPADEVVQVPPEAPADLEVTLEPVAQRTKAKIRGVISSAAGPVAKATVRIVELKLKQAVKPDGRFEAEVPGGKYTLVIEAPKHVTQTRPIEVLDGDQAIFQIELEKTR